MLLAAIVIAVLLDQVRPAGSGHAIAMLTRRWMHAVARYADTGRKGHAWLVWALAAAAPALAAALIGWLCGRAAGWFGQLAWAVAVLYFTLGFRQFSHHATAIRDALTAGDQAQARALLTRWQGEQPGYFGALPQGLAGLGSLRDSVAREAIAHAVLFAHRWVFGVLFWFCLLAPLGLAPAGAVLYHCAEFATRYWRGKPDAEPAASDALRAAVQTAWRVIDWLPVRVTALVFAIVGNFEDAIAAWQQRQADEAQGGAGRDNDAVLLAAAAGALGIRLDADDAAARVPVAEPVKPGVPVQPDRAPAPTDAPAPAYPPDWEPSARADEAALPGRNDMSGSFGAEPDVRHFAQVAGLLWRGVALWLLLLMLLTLAHVLG